MKLGLCVDTSLLNHANQYMCGLVATFSKLVLTEATKITGLLVSTKCTRTIQVGDGSVQKTIDLVQGRGHYI